MDSNEKTIFVFIVAISLILVIFTTYYLDYFSLISDVFSQSVQGFVFVRAKASTINLTTGGNLTIGFINLWPGTITVVNLTAYNRNSGICILPENSLSYNGKMQNLPMAVSVGDTFRVYAIRCAPFKTLPRKGDKFYVNMTVEYVIAEKYMASYGKEAVHKESGMIEGRYM